jgi:hypothetical protein
MRKGRGGGLRFTAAGLLSTEKRTAMTASAIPSFNILPSHSSSTSPLLLWRTVTQSITKYAVDFRTISSIGSSSDSFMFESLFVPFVGLLSVISWILPKVPCRAHLIKSIPAALNVIRCLQVIVVVVNPAYSLRSSGAIKDILKSFCTRTPVNSWDWLSSAEGGGIAASFPTTLAILSALNGMRTSSQFRGL